MSAVLEAREPSSRYLDAIEPKLVQQFDLLVGASAGVMRLRELILALAMLGKLVPQESTDESAVQLVMRLMTERGASTQRRRSATRTGVHPAGQARDSLPSSWAVASLSAISMKLTDGSHNPPRDAGSGVPMLSSQNVLESGTIDFDSPTRYVSIDDFERENARTNATPGDVLLTIVASLGRSAVVPVDAPAFVLQRSVAVIRTGLNPSFLAMFLRSPAARAYYDEHGKGTAQKGIYLGKLGELTLPIPPLAEQARIVARVDELMRLCDALEAKGRLEAEQHARLLGTLLGTLTDSTTPEELAANWQLVADHFDLLLDRPEAVDALEQTILQLAVRGLLVPQDPTDEPVSVLLEMTRGGGDRRSGVAGDEVSQPRQTDGMEQFVLPRSWEEVALSQLCAVVTDGEHATPERCDDPTQVPLVTAKNVRSESMDYTRTDYVSREVAERCWRRCKPQAGDILMVSVGATLGRLCVLQESIDMVLVRSVTMLRPHVGVADASYLALHLMSPGTQSEIWASVKQSAQPCLYLSKSSALRIALPPYKEQLRIVARVTELRLLCADLRHRLERGSATRTALADALIDQALAV